MVSLGRIVGGILLVAGTAIGAGMLALPVSTGLAGFFPAICLMTIAWIFMTYTALLMLEVNLSMGENNNLITMAKHTLGKWGESVSWIAYLFLLYALTTAYIAGSGPITIEVVNQLTGFTIPSYVGSIPLLLLFGIFVYKGTASVDYVNRFLMFGLVVTYVLMVAFLAPHVNSALLTFTHWKSLLVASSVVVTSFGFHIIIPTLSTYLHRDVKALKMVILIGSAIPLIVYIIWELLTLGILPHEGEHGIIKGYVEGINGAQLLAGVLGHTTIGVVARFFSFFAIVTSFLGVSLSLSDFLADGFKIKKTRLGRVMLYALTFFPPLFLAVIDPRAFLTALEYAGAFGVIVLLGLLPAFMVWSKRYWKHLKSPYTAPGGKASLIIVIILSCLGIGLEIAAQMGLIKGVYNG